MSEVNVTGLSSLVQSLLRLPRPTKRVVMLVADATMLPVTLWVSLVLKYDRLFAIERYGHLLAATVVIGLSAFSLLGLYRAVIRFMGPKAMAAVVMAVTLMVVTLGIYDRSFGVWELPLSALAMFWAAALLYVAGSRFLIRYMFFYGIHGRTAKRVAIYGAGEAGARLSSVLLGGPDFEPVAFIDDKRALQGNHINGIKVHSPKALPKLMQKHGIERVLLAMPSASKRRRREILTVLEPLGLHVQLLPDLSDIISG